MTDQNSATREHIGLVVIGRNEGDRLKRCLASASGHVSTIVYVDSGSTDDSVSFARSHGVHVVELDMTVPFTAARARNSGFRKLLEIEPGLELVQFVDGDVEIVDAWLDAAAEYLHANEKAAAVSGRRRERHPDQSVFNRLCDIEWNKPPNYPACEGDALMRVAAFREVDGFNESLIAGEEPELCLPRGAGVQNIAEALEREGVISNALLFRLGAKVQGAERSLKAGEYAIPAGASMAEVLDRIRRGEVVQRKITVAEGLTSYDIVQLVNAAEMLEGEIAEIPPEGSLAPETYFYERGESRAEVIARMRAAQASALDALWEKRAEGLPIETKEEALILASIVEKETGVPEERPRVASVFVNRLRKRMRLQTDPTVIYGITLGKGPLDRPIRRSDLNAKTPYNTYQIDGLPPTPIANPGRAAIEAVLNPAQTDDLYFVADGTGGHVFAKTLAEHNKNVRAWRKIEAARKRGE